MSKADAEQKNEFCFNDNELEQAALLVRDALAELTPQPEDEAHIFSGHFLVEMNVLLKKTRIHHSLKKLGQSAAAVILLLLISSVVWLSFDVEARADFIQWIRNEYEDSIVYNFFNKKESSDFPDVEVQWLPEGFTESFSEYSNGSGDIIFTDSNGREIIFSYYIMTLQSSTSITQDGSIVHEEVLVNGKPADFYQDLDEADPNILWWTDEDSGIALELNALLTKDELVEIAENVQVNVR